MPEAKAKETARQAILDRLGLLDLQTIGREFAFGQPSNCTPDDCRDGPNDSGFNQVHAFGASGLPFTLVVGFTTGTTIGVSKCVVSCGWFSVWEFTMVPPKSSEQPNKIT